MSDEETFIDAAIAEWENAEPIKVTRLLVEALLEEHDSSVFEVALILQLEGIRSELDQISDAIWKIADK